MHFTNFDSARFLRESWQQQPLLIRNPWEEWRNPLAPDELAGLACEGEVESRLVVQEARSWRLENGPFTAERFSALDAQLWSLLVQAVDQFVPEVAALIAPFRFVPNWRIDDVMVSYASDGGGVGPHYDQYDVFLIQGLGQRRWRVGPRCDETTPLLPHDDLRLLAGFQATQEWLLEPGDILYVPPGFAHDGVAVGDDCMTYSIGFRAPSRSELIEGWSEDLLEQLTEDDRYADPGLQLQTNPGEITPAAIAALQAMVIDRLADQAGFARWFGQYCTTRKYPELDWQPDELLTLAELRELLAEDQPLLRNPASRFVFVRTADEAVQLFVDGACYACSGAVAVLAEQLCGHEKIRLDAELTRTEASLELLLQLINQGSLTTDAED